VIGFGGEISDKRCSRAGCTETATFNVNWRNPKIHGLDRVKVWLACDEHRDFLREFLLARNFPVVVTDINVPVTVVADGAGAK
jgi:hypothetical protein